MIIGDVDFSLSRYEKLCKAIEASRYDNMTIREYLEKYPGHYGVLLMRHDVDRDVRYALDIARIEHEHGIKATYYFRPIKTVFIPEAIERIASWGHEVGYHYDTLDKCGGDVDRAALLFHEELSEFRRYFDVKTVCMHGNPLTRYDNRDIWKKYRLTDFGLLGEPYLSLDYDRFKYYSDSGRNWNPGKNKVKDTINSKKEFLAIRDSNGLIDILGTSYPSNLCILTHPERWNKKLSGYVRRYLVDHTINAGKAVIMKVRR